MMPTPNDDKYYIEPDQAEPVCSCCYETEGLWEIDGEWFCKDCREGMERCEMCHVPAEECKDGNGDVDYCTECFSVECFEMWNEETKGWS